jgi:ATP-binding cassette subfamily B protein
MEYSLMSNVKYVYKESFKNYPRVKWFLVINFFTEIVVPIFAILLTTLVVYALTNDVAIELYILYIAGMIVVGYIFESIRYWSYLRYTFENTFTRFSTFLYRLAEHQVKTDYINIESNERKKTISKAFEAIDGNYHGIEMMLRQSPLLLINLVGILIYGVLIAIYVPFVLGILFLMSIMNYILTKRANKYLTKIKSSLSDEFSEKYYLTKDATNPNYGKDIRLYNLGKWFNELFVKLTKNRRNGIKKIEKRFMVANFSNTLFLFLRDFIAYAVLLNLVINNEIDLTTFTFLTAIVAGFSMWLNGFTTSFNTIRSSSVSVTDYRYCIEVENSFDKEGLPIDEVTTPIAIEFNNVTFSYPLAEKPTIEHLSFKIDASEKIALVGNNGAGKTTIIKLLCGLYKADEGSITINGVDINEYNINEYMSLLSVVFQDSEPLSMTVENIVSCKRSQNIDKDKLWKSLQGSGLKEKVLSLDKKEETYITKMFDESGVRLSGGEIQKLMLARSLYKNAPILILDEPTAALDPIAEETLYLQYEELVKNTTSVFISHRLSSTKFCDRILFLDDGKIIEQGSHTELMKLNKQYREVFDIQAKYYKEGDDCERN